MAKKKRVGELPSGNIRRRVFLGYEYLTDEDGNPILDEKGKQKKKRLYSSVTAANSHEADSLADEIRVTKKSVKHIQTEDTFIVARAKYIESMRNILSPSTIRGYKQMNTYYDQIDQLKIKDFSDEVLQGWVASFSGNHSPKTTRNAYGLITRVLSNYGLSFSVTLPKKKVNNVYVPSDQDVQTIVKYFMDKNDMDMIIAICLAAFATLRRSEICGLDASDVDGCDIHVHNSVVVDDNKTNVIKDSVKNTTSDRFITIPKYVVDMFPKEGKLVTISPDNITNRFGKAMHKCDIPHFRFHDLRHYSASIMHAINIPDVYIMERGGWKTDHTLKRVYRGSIEDYKKKFVEQTNTYFETMHHVCTTKSD